MQYKTSIIIKQDSPFYSYAVMLVLCCSLLFSACKKVIDEVKNEAAVGQETVWSDPKSIQFALNYIYAAAQPDNFGGSFPNGNGNQFAYAFRYYNGTIADEGRPSATFLGRTNNINNGVNFTAANSPFQLWPYAAIRQCNDFLEKINTQYTLPADAAQTLIDQRNAFIGQVKFFRAYQYWRMVQIYGGVPIVSSVLNAGDEALYNPRNTQEECFQFIKNDLDSAALLLPATYGSIERGRITKGAATALLSRVLLNRASPMYNATNIEYWQDAADAAKAVLDMNYALYPAFGRWFFDKDNPETIWQLEFTSANSHGWDAGNHPVAWAIGDAVAISPTEELVESFPMLNGKAITNPTSGYNPNDPYANRDPRLRATVIINGDVFGKNPTIKGDDGILGSAVKIWTYIGGGDGYSESGTYTTSTGYDLRKAMDTTLVTPAVRIYNYGVGSTSNWVEIRLAEVMMNYAEAENELGNTEPAYTYLKMIRERAGIEAGGDGNYGIPAGLGKDEMRAFIQNERFIEFAFENKRYWDLKRWKLAASVLSRPTHTMRITKVTAAVPPNLTTDAANFSFDPTGINVNDRSYPPVFLEKFYFLPIPQKELQLNSKITQNPLW